METGIDVTERGAETNIIHSISQYHAALNALVVRPEIQNPINRSAHAVGLEFNIDEAELAEHITQRLPHFLATINIANPDWEEQLSRWCRSVARKHGLNILNHRSDTEKKYEDLTIHLNSKGKQNSHRMLRSDIPTPEDELSMKEEAPIWEARAEDARARTRALISEDPVAYLWSKGYKPRQIAALLNKSPKTIYGRLSRLHKAVIQEIGFTESAENKALIKEGLRELYANSLEPPEQNTANPEDTALLNVSVSAGSISKRSEVSVVIHKRPRKKSPRNPGD